MPVWPALRTCLALLILAALPALASAAPSITSLSPTSGPVGTSVTITGSAFGTTQGNSTVKFNGTTATTITSWSATSIVATVPSGATTGNVVVRVSNSNSNGKPFTVVTNITSLSPTSGAVGTAVTIAGSSFGATQGTSSVKFNGTTAAITSWSADSIVTSVPAGSSTGNVVVRVNNVDSAGKPFTVIPAPAITSLSPTSGVIGTTVTVTGSNFGATKGSSTLKFNGTLATTSSWSASSIVAVVPAGSTTGPVVVQTSGGTSNGSAFTVLPTITGLSPASGGIGAAVAIYGSNFGSTQGTGTVRFNGTLATVSSWSASTVRVVVPTGATTGNIVVQTAAGSSNGLSFTVAQPPTITSVSPPSGRVGASITISGTNFGAIRGIGSVRFGGKVAEVVSWSSTSVVVSIPSGANGALILRANGMDTAAVPFSVLASFASTEAGAERSGAAYVASATAVLHQPKRLATAPRVLEVQMAWFHSSGQLFAVDRFTASPTSLLKSAVIDTVRTNLAPPYRVVVRLRETAVPAPTEVPGYTCNNDLPYPAQPACTSDQLPAPIGTVLGEELREINIAALP